MGEMLSIISFPFFLKLEEKKSSYFLEPQHFAFVYLTFLLVVQTH